MTVSISARALLELLAGRLTQDHFQHAIGMDASRGRANLFKLCLDRGEVISAVRLEPGGVDEDDDRFVIEFSKDPSASALSIGATEGGATSSTDAP